MRQLKVLDSNGCIPAQTECPYREACLIAKKGDCVHRGVEHMVPFSCAAARAFAMIDSFDSSKKS